jgi:hypothetical protein
VISWSTIVSPQSRRLATLLLGAVMLTAFLAPGVALAAGPPRPVDDAIVTQENVPATGNVLANDDNLGGGTLTVTSYGPLSPLVGELVIDPNGDYTFTPATDWNGSASTTYDVANDTHTRTANINITVTPVNEAPTAVDDTVTVTEDTATDVTAAILANDTDPDGDTLAVSGVSNATGGSAELAAGVVTFTPDANLCGTAAGGFDYDLSDGNGGSDSAQVTVDVTCVNDAPTAVDDTASVDQGSGTADYDVLANDFDVDGDSLTLVSASVDPSAGNASVDGSMVSFTPLPAFSGEAVITYQISDGTLTADATLTITVGPDTTPPVPVAPTVAFGSGRVNQSAPLRISWSAADAASGVASYEVQVSVNGGAFAAVYAGAGTSVTRFYPFRRSLVWRVRATDGVGNVSDWATSAPRRIVPYQDSSRAIAYTGAWTRVRSRASSGTSYSYTTTLKKRARLTFTGQSVLYVAPRSRLSGDVKVYVDGRSIGRFSLHSSRTKLGRIIARASWGTGGTHTIKLVNVQGGRRTSLDAFIVLK